MIKKPLTNKSGEVRELSATDIRAMFDAATRIGDISLLIVDPVVNAVAGDSQKNGEVRRALQPLVDFGEKLDCAVLGISHFSKGTQGKDPLERVTASLAFGAVARVVLVTAKPLGVRNGVYLQHTGAVRKIDAVAIQRRLDQNEIVLLSPIGYSPTGEVFNLTVEDVATHAATALKAEKLIFLMDAPGVTDAKGRLIKDLSTQQAAKLVKAARSLTPDVEFFLPCAVQACQNGVARAHLISRHIDGAILQELFTMSGIGTMVAPEPVESMRQATVDDVAVSCP